MASIYATKQCHTYNQTSLIRTKPHFPLLCFLSSSTNRHERHRVFSPNGTSDDGAALAPKSGSRTAIAALLAGDQRLRCRHIQRTPTDTSSKLAIHGLLKMIIFEFTNSSPEKHDKASKQERPILEAAFSLPSSFPPLLNAMPPIRCT